MDSAPFIDVLRRLSLNLVSARQQSSSDMADWPNRSGFVVEHMGGQVLVTAAHRLFGKPWWLELRGPSSPAFPDTPAKIVHYQIPEFYHFESADTPEAGIDVPDFALAPLDMGKINLLLSQEGVPIGSHLYYVYRGDYPVPIESGSYGFLAYAGGYIVPSISLVEREEIIVTNMKFIGSDDEGLYRFKVSGSFRKGGYHGCSGAPIFNKDKKIVALVKGGAEEEKIITAFPFGTFLDALSSMRGK
jgi:hypothetical protein